MGNTSTRDGRKGKPQSGLPCSGSRHDCPAGQRSRHRHHSICHVRGSSGLAHRRVRERIELKIAHVVRQWIRSKAQLTRCISSRYAAESAGGGPGGRSGIARGLKSNSNSRSPVASRICFVTRRVNSVTLVAESSSPYHSRARSASAAACASKGSMWCCLIDAMALAIIRCRDVASTVGWAPRGLWTRDMLGREHMPSRHGPPIQ